MIGTSEMHARVREEGQIILGSAQAAAAALQFNGPADKPTRDREVGRAMVLAIFAVLQGDPEDRPNRIRIVEGIGQAIGEGIGQQPAANQAVIYDALIAGLQDGFERAKEEFRPRGSA